MKELLLLAGGSLLVLALYSFAGTSDRLDELTAEQREEIVARWVAR